MNYINMNQYKRLICLLPVLLLLGFNASGQQKEVSRSSNTWFMLMNEVRFSPKWSVSNEVHIRRADFLKDWQQFLLRPAVNYRLNSHVDLSLGYSYVLTYPYGEQPVKMNIPEHNVWQQVQLRHAVGKVSIMHRYRLEERFVGFVQPLLNGDYEIDGADYAQRFRYRLTARVPLLKMREQKEFFAAAFDELWINLENNFSVNSFNQNWFYVGLGYQFSSMGNLQAGYLNQVIRKGDGAHYEKNPTISVSLFYNFDLGVIILLDKGIKWNENSDSIINLESHHTNKVRDERTAVS